MPQNAPKLAFNELSQSLGTLGIASNQRIFKSVIEFRVITDFSPLFERFLEPRQ
jgi:hypothetical protein